MSGPAFSILTAAYDSAATLEACIGSVVAQTVPDWELIVVDDGSTDDSLTIAQRYAAEDDRIRVIAQENAGTAAARNRGLAEATGRHFLILDADDRLLPNYLESQTAFMAEHEGYDIYSCNADIEVGGRITRTLWEGPGYDRAFSLDVADQLRDSSIHVMSVFTPRVLELTGGFRDLHVEDYDFWLRAMIAGATHRYNSETLCVYRRSPEGRTGQLLAEAEGLLAVQREACEHPDLPADARAACADILRFSEARVERRRLEERLMRGEYRGARRAVRSGRAAFGSSVSYAMVFVLTMVSPRLYAAFRRARRRRTG